MCVAAARYDFHERTCEHSRSGFCDCGHGIVLICQQFCRGRVDGKKISDRIASLLLDFAVL